MHLHMNLQMKYRYTLSINLVYAITIHNDLFSIFVVINTDLRIHFSWDPPYLLIPSGHIFCSPDSWIIIAELYRDCWEKKERNGQPFIYKQSSIIKKHVLWNLQFSNFYKCDFFTLTMQSLNFWIHFLAILCPSLKKNICFLGTAAPGQMLPHGCMLLLY